MIRTSYVIINTNIKQNYLVMSGDHFIRKIQIITDPRFEHLSFLCKNKIDSISIKSPSFITCIFYYEKWWYTIYYIYYITPNYYVPSGNVGWNHGTQPYICSYKTYNWTLPTFTQTTSTAILLHSNRQNICHKQQRIVRYRSCMC